jgi:3-isopropylmalate dehydrogenase
VKATILTLPGDGIGPEVMAEAKKVLEAVARRFDHQFEMVDGEIGGAAIDRHGTALPAATVQMARTADAVLLAAVGGPKWDDPSASVRPEQGLLALRKVMGVFANLRPVKNYPFLGDSGALKSEAVRDVDLVVIRELTGGLYFGRPQRRWTTSRGRRAVDTLRYTEQEIERIIRFGFETARARRRRLTSVDKANVLASSRLWREIANELAPQFPDVTLEHLLVDACAMHLIRKPADFDVIVTENMFGDILTDEASMLAGSLGMLPSASIGRRRRDGSGRGLYEPIHGSAPDIAGRGIANPLGLILSSAMLLRISLRLEREAAAVESAVEGALSTGARTADIAAQRESIVGTKEMGARVADMVAAVTK